MLAVIGAQGFLGRHITTYWRETSQSVVTASHRRGSDVLIEYSSESGLSPLPLACGVCHAVICTAQTSLDSCFLDQDGSRSVNVDLNIALIKQCFSLSIIPIFCSTDLVFKGDLGHYRENDCREPTTQYGIQKKTVEDFLLSHDSPSLILRFSKIVSLNVSDLSPVGEIYRAVQKGQKVRCADDQMICPIFVDDVVKVLEWAIKSRRTGCYHVTGPRSYSRYELGRVLAKSLGHEELIEPCSIDEFDFQEQRPKDVTLNNNKLNSEYYHPLISVEEKLSQLATVHTMADCDGI